MTFFFSFIAFFNIFKTGSKLSLNQSMIVDIFAQSWSVYFIEQLVTMHSNVFFSAPMYKQNFETSTPLVSLIHFLFKFKLLCLFLLVGVVPKRINFKLFYILA